MIQAKQMHKLPTANHRRAALVIHPHQVHPTAVQVTAPIVKQVRRTMSHKKKKTKTVSQVFKSRLSVGQFDTIFLKKEKMNEDRGHWELLKERKREREDAISLTRMTIFEIFI